MASDSPTDCDDWRDRGWVWAASGTPLPPEQQSELRLYCAQENLRSGFEVRRNALEEKIRSMIDTLREEVYLMRRAMGEKGRLMRETFGQRVCFETSDEPVSFIGRAWDEVRLVMKTFDGETRTMREALDKELRLMWVAQDEKDQLMREALNAKVHLMKKTFERDEKEWAENIVYSFAARLSYQGVEETQRKMVPAYMFTKFLLLPAEIRLKIWSMACRIDEPTIHEIESMRWHSLRGSSTISHGCESVHWQFPAVPHVCQESRAAALKVYTCLPCSHELRGSDHAWVNTLYNSFYIGGDKWTRFKIFIDLLIRQNTTRPLPNAIMHHLASLTTIRFLIVEFNIFGAVPAKLWFEFPKLQVLTIAFYPRDRILDVEPSQGKLSANIRLVKTNLQRWPRFQRRAAWIHRVATDSLSAAKKEEALEGKIPGIEVVLQRTGDEELDKEINGELGADYVASGGEGPGLNRSNATQSSDNNRDDDSLWYKEAAARVTQTVSMTDIKLWKQKYHSSRWVGSLQRLREKPIQPMGSHYTDSEHDSGNMVGTITADGWS